MSVKKEPHVYINNLAYRKFKYYRGYVNIKELQERLRVSILSEYKKGMELDSHGIGKVRVAGNIYAVVRLKSNAWRVLNFIQIYSKR